MASAKRCRIKDDQPQLVEGEDFYREGPYIVFTEQYLRKRGYCCESGCRHCPYGFKLARDKERHEP